VKRKATRSNDTHPAPQHTGIDSSKTLCPSCDAVVGTLQDFCHECGRTLRPIPHKHVEDCVQGLNVKLATRFGHLREMCHYSDEMEGAFERE
jgi:predicted amidophosphoribosyltransferase